MREDYYFMGWYLGETPLTDGKGKGLDAWHHPQDTTLTAKWADSAYTIVADTQPQAGGQVTGAGTYASDTSVLLVATPTPRYAFLGGMTRGDNLLSSSSIHIPASVTRIDGGAFTGCSALAQVYIEDLALWCGVHFSNATSNPMWQGATLYVDGVALTTLTVPDMVTSIENYAFYGCESITQVNIHAGVTAIGKQAFGKCANLATITCDLTAPGEAWDGEWLGDCTATVQWNTEE